MRARAHVVHSWTQNTAVLTQSFSYPFKYQCFYVRASDERLGSLLSIRILAIEARLQTLPTISSNQLAEARKSLELPEHGSSNFERAGGRLPFALRSYAAILTRSSLPSLV